MPVDTAALQIEGLRGRLRYLALARIAFATFLLVAAVAVRLGWGGTEGERLGPLYGFTAAVYALSLLYLALWRVAPPRLLGYCQVLADVGCVTALIYLGGGADSAFTFLYFPVIIAASALLLRRGGMLAASASAAALGLLLGLQLHGCIPAPGAAPLPNVSRLLYGALIHTAAFFLVAALTSYLAEEARASARKLTAKQQEVARLEVFNRYVVQSMTSGLVTTDTERRVTSLNLAAGHILGVNEDGVLGAPLAELLPEVDGRLEELANEGERTSRNDLTFRRADGGEVQLGFSVSPLRGGAGEMIGHVLIFRDLTRLRQMEDRLRQLDRLAAVGELAGGIAHEIRNPLAAISGGVQMLQAENARLDTHLDGAGPENCRLENRRLENQRLMEIVLREVSRLNGLVADFLLFARPGSRPRQRLDLSGVVAEAIDAAVAAAAAQRPPEGVSVERDVPEGLWLEASPEEMRQVVSNLVRNALEAMPEGGRLRVEGQAQEGQEGQEGQVRLCVCDTGCGISRDDLGHIFSPFFTRKERGTGLGLAIVHAIVEHHGGRIEVESAPGATTFTIWLPSAAAQPAHQLAA